MIVAIDRSKHGGSRKFVRSILSRYLWKLGPGTFAGPNRALRDRIVEELENLAARSQTTDVTIITVDPVDPKGVKIEIIKSK